MRMCSSRIKLVALVMLALALPGDSGRACASTPTWPDVKGFAAFQAKVVKVFPESSEVKLVSESERTAIVSMHDLGPKSLEQLRKVAPPKARQWTDSKGKTVQGTLLSIDRGEVDLWVGDRLFKLPFERLSKADRAHVKQVALQRVVDRVLMLKIYNAFGDPIGSATGFVIDSRGWLATNYHVIRDAARIDVEIDGNTTTIKQCVAVDRNNDLAVLPCPAAQELHPPLRLAKQLPNIGDDIWTVGFPREVPNNGRGSVGKLPRTRQFPANFRVFLQQNRSIPFPDDTQWIQVQQASVLPGSSGGPLIDESGFVLGVNTWVAGGAFGQAVAALHLQDLLQSAASKAAFAPLPLPPVGREPTARSLHPDVAKIIIRNQRPGLMPHQVVQAARSDLMALAKTNPKHWSSKQSAFLAGQASCLDPNGGPWIDAAGDFLLTHHARTHAIHELAAQATMCNLPAAGDFCLQVLRQNNLASATRTIVNVALLNHLLHRLDTRQGENSQQLAPLRNEIDATLQRWQKDLAKEMVTLTRDQFGQVQLTNDGLNVPLAATHPAFQASIDEHVRTNKTPDCPLAALAEGAKYYLDNLSIGAPAPNFCGKNANGDPRCLKNLNNKVVLLDFFADWCGPCRSMYPLERNLQGKSKTDPKWKDNFILVGVTQDPVETIQARIDSKTITWNVCFDKPPKGQSPTLEMYRVNSYPMMLLLDKKGIIRYRWVGVGPGLEKQLHAAIDKLVAE